MAIRDSVTALVQVQAVGHHQTREQKKVIDHTQSEGQERFDSNSHQL